MNFNTGISTVIFASLMALAVILPVESFGQDEGKKLMPEVEGNEQEEEGHDGLVREVGLCDLGPDGEWVLEPQIGIEGVMVADFSLGKVYGERQNFDPSGHYSRPDVTRLVLDRSRQTILGFGEADI